MIKHTLVAATLAATLAASFATQPVVAQEPFYKGKTVTIVVGPSPGGGFDTYARFLARHLSKHVAGAPVVIVANMPGAGSNIAANYIYNSAAKDGTFIGAIYGGTPLEPLIGVIPVQHDPRRTQYIGSANNDVYVCIVRKDAPFGDFKDVLQKEMLIGAQHSSPAADVALVLNEVLGTKFKLVMGYPGSREIALAVDRGEVQGGCGFAWPSVAVTNSGWFGEGKPMRVLAQTHPAGHPSLNKEGIFNVMSTATPEQRAILEVYFSQQVFGRPYVVAPEVPADRVALLRKAFLDTFRDPALVEEAKKANLEVNPVAGEEVAKMVANVYAAPPEAIQRIKKGLAAAPK